MTRRILVVFTGGTIGSRVGAESISVVQGATHALLDRYLGSRSDPSRLQFEVLEPLNILSENAHPTDWGRLAVAIQSRDLSQYDGVIVTHGTDTLAFAGSALAFALSRVPIPVVLVSSNYPLDDSRANGHQNFADAIEYIAQVREPGVVAVYQNPDSRRLVHRAARLQNATPLDHYFRSLGNSEIGEFVDSTFRPSPVPERVVFGGGGLAPVFDPGVLYVHPYPGLSYSRIDLSAVRAVVHGLYHSGTACVDVADPGCSLVGFAHECSSRGIPLLIASVPDAGKPYESSAELSDTGVVPVPDMRAETVLVKTMMGVGNGMTGSSLTDFVATQNLAYEFLAN